MSLKNQIIEDMKAAMKQKDAMRLSTLRMVKASIMNREIEIGKEMSDDEVIKSLNTLVKQRRDSAEQYANAGRQELADKENAEIQVLEDYLPSVATPDEIEQAVTGAIRESGADSMKDMGLVMKDSLARLSGKTVDGKAVSDLVRQRLS